MSTPPPRDNSVRESRDARRFTARRPLPAQFLGIPVIIQNLSGGGVQIEHSERIKLGTCGTLRVDRMQAGEEMVFPARIVWSHLSKNVDSAGKFRYQSGLLLIEQTAEAIGALGRLIHAYGAPDTGSLDRKKVAIEEKLKGQTTAAARAIPVTDEQIERIRAARAHLQVHLDEAQKWYNRAKFAFANSDFAVAYPVEVLAIWEFTGRTIALPTIVEALRQAR